MTGGFTTEDDFEQQFSDFLSFQENNIWNILKGHPIFMKKYMKYQALKKQIKQENITPEIQCFLQLNEELLAAEISCAFISGIALDRKMRDFVGGRFKDVIYDYCNNDFSEEIEDAE